MNEKGKGSGHEHRRESARGLGAGILFSFVVHLAVLAMVASWSGTPERLREPEPVFTLSLRQVEMRKASSPPATKAKAPERAPTPREARRTPEPPKVSPPKVPNPPRSPSIPKAPDVSVKTAPRPMERAATVVPAPAATNPVREAPDPVPAPPEESPNEELPPPMEEVPSPPPVQAPSTPEPTGIRGEPGQEPVLSKKNGVSPASASASGDAGEASSPVSTAEDPPRHQDLARAYLRELKALIEKERRYPVMARRNRMEGDVVVQARLARDGTLKEAKIGKSSGISLLDRAALEAVRRVRRFPPAPTEISGEEISLGIPVSYRLR